MAAPLSASNGCPPVANVGLHEAQPGATSLHVLRRCLLLKKVAGVQDPSAACHERFYELVRAVQIRP